MKKLFLYLALLWPMFLFAQEPTEPNPYEQYPDLPELPCFVEKIENFSRITFENEGTLIVLRFENLIPQQLVFTKTETGEQLMAQQISDNELSLVLSGDDENIDFSQINSCGEVKTTTIYLNTMEETATENEREAIFVSRGMGKLLEKFGYGDTPLYQILQEDETVSSFEKIAFYQQYALSGRDLPLPMDDFLDPQSPTIDGLWPKSCLILCLPLNVNVKRSL